MGKKWILVFDSGTGGKYTMEQIRQYLPHENYLLFMDKTNCPYGNKTKLNLKKIITKTLKKLIAKFDIKLIVIACNTISSMFAGFLQKKFYDVPFVFVLPTVNENILQNSTLILCTKNTAKYNKNLKKYKKQKNVWVQGFDNLAKKIDDCNGDFNILQPYLNKKLKRFAIKKPVNVVLGCTHFNYIKEQINTALKTNVNFFENSQDVSFKVKNKLVATSNLSRKKAVGELLVLYHIS